MFERSLIVGQQVGSWSYWLGVAAIVLLFAPVAVTGTAGGAMSKASLTILAGLSRGMTVGAVDLQTPWVLPHRGAEIDYRDGRRAGPGVPATGHGKSALIPATPKPFLPHVVSGVFVSVSPTHGLGFACHCYGSQAPPLWHA
jgi:hypothetical protein